MAEEATGGGYDLAIIGGGPAGLTAAIYGSRSGLKVVVLEKGLPGGQVQNTLAIENYPGFPEVSGYELGQRFHEHAMKFGAEVRVTTVESVRSSEAGVWIETADGPVQARTALVSTGAGYRKLGVPGEREYTAKGISNCAVCDGFFFKDKDVCVVGGGDAAVEEGLYLTRFARQVTVIHRRDALRAQKIIQDRALADSKVKFLWDTTITEVLGDGERVSGLRLRNVKTGEETVRATDGLFVYIGTVPNTAFLGDGVERDEEGFLVTHRGFRTAMRGVFAAGDVRSGAWRQIVVVAAEGALATREIEHWLDGCGSEDW